MELLTYLILVTFYFSSGYLIYKLILEKITFFNVNRFYLLAVMVLSLVFPFIDFSIETNNQFLVQNLPEITVSENLSDLSYNFSTSLFNILYGGISGLFLFYFIISLGIVIRRINLLKNPQHSVFQPFSFFSFIYVPHLLSEEEQHAIVEHEKVHANQWHTIDILMAEIYKAFFWFNPLVWIMVKDIKTNHEFIADEIASKKTKSDYEAVLTAQFLGISINDLANNFNNELLTFKRIKMMKTQKSTLKKAMYYLLVIPTMAINFLIIGNIELYAQTNDADKIEAKQDENGNYIIVEEMPQFKGGIDALFKYLGENVKYPPEAKNQEISGKVFISFIVDKKGKIKDVKVVRGVDPLLDNEALRVVSTMPKWKAGKHQGKKVNVLYNLPISFVLK
ncbi:MAG: hypothetical protein COW67_04875 [Flavobacteriales bacterium CG18_big_fil_WC_8_21_14_2_50_32_9]|nr:MAG: hypothetical protein COW67_04875 [Flavobacteriales bacterium CG18_big_fil_WC_8_21_14_2_50_32_9]PJC61543.1 MAG: hypothetical protein CO022_09265 [Flavobacteriales bacterium CG_4_9_14_0_2_um_filter_32_27]